MLATILATVAVSLSLYGAMPLQDRVVPCEADTFFVVDTVSKYDSIVLLDDVKISGHSEKDFQMTSSQNKVQVNREYLEDNFTGSLSQTLEIVPGVKAISIGSSQSKPTIRGMGFNRMAVAENGIKHSSQQWGDDHGLEINQFEVDKVEIIKGPSALQFGSDAIGGVMNLFTNYAPLKDFEGSFLLTGRSNNQHLGLSAKIGGRSNKLFYKAGISVADYADYKVTADSIQYSSYWIKLKDKRLRNTAGKEYDADIMLGYIGKRFHTDIKISDNFSKSGFFADAHGLEVRLSNIDYDKSKRDICLPYQQVNHLKILSHSVLSLDKINLEANVAYQNNLREEHSEPISHGYMPTPDNTKERMFNKNTYTANIGLSAFISENNTLQGGINTELQKNDIDGWGFIIPTFSTLSLGGYLFDKHTIKENFIINGGIRYDYASTHIHGYSDWYKTPVGWNDSVYKQRSEDIKRNFNSLTYSFGLDYNIDEWIFKVNMGKSFRIPIAKELGADGINYHIFRYEKGNSSLDAEQSYQLDAGIKYTDSRIAFQADPYVNYFPNYIYLNPTAAYTEGLQTYYYTQAEVFRYGFELQVSYLITSYLQAEFQTEYLSSKQLSGPKKGYSLPFSVPWSMDCGLRYTFDKNKSGFIAINIHVVGDQNEIVPPEKTTEGYWILNMQASKRFRIGKNDMKVALQIKNILDKRYFDHTSYYRLIDVPEPSRNISLSIGYNF